MWADITRPNLWKWWLLWVECRPSQSAEVMALVGRYYPSQSAEVIVIIAGCCHLQPAEALGGVLHYYCIRLGQISTVLKGVAFETADLDLGSIVPQ